MKAGIAAVGGLGSILAAAVAAGVPVLVLLGVTLALAAGLSCWIIANRDRTENTVAIITAARARPETPAPAQRPRRTRRTNTGSRKPVSAVPATEPTTNPQLEQTDT